MVSPSRPSFLFHFMQHPTPTKYLNDFLAYYARAKILEDRNHRGGKRKTCGDPLQDNVTIYDTVHRRCAGFSNVLRDLHADKKIRWDLKTWLFVYGIHRMTGSGASFFPKSEGERRHGYCNVIAPSFAGAESIGEMVDMVKQRVADKLPMFTSHGNQPPPFPKPQDDYSTGGVYFFCEVWPSFVEMIAEELELKNGASIVEFTDWMIELNRTNGFKAFKFAYTAFVMDIADWHPEFMDPRSQCHYGANCLVAMNAMFSDHNRTKGKSFYHEAMEQLIPACSKILGEEACPMDVEDACCDAVRYWSRFVPRHGYAHLTPEQTATLSKIPHAEFEAFCAVS